MSDRRKNVRNDTAVDDDRVEYIALVRLTELGMSAASD